MNNELLNYLKSSIIQDWLHYYSSDLRSDRQQKDAEYISGVLYRSTQAKLAQISNIVLGNHRKLAVFIVEDNPVDFMATFLASVIAEVDLFLCDPGWQLREWQQVLNLVQPDLIFGDRSTKSLISQLKLTQQRSPDFLADKKPTDRGLIMIPTGGTSGKIRFVMHNWSTLSASVTGFKSFFACQNINSFCTLPLYHVSGLMQFMRSLLTQGNLVICPYKRIATEQINLDRAEYFISLVPTQLQFLLESTPQWLGEFKTVLVGGAPASRSLLNTAREYNIPISSIYGMTETASGVVALKPQDFLAGNNSSGQVLPHAQVSINNTLLKDNAERKESGIKNIKLAKIKAGSIEISGTSLCLGYYPQLFPPAQPFAADDFGYFDAEGYLYLLGRNSQKIITGGENVFPAEIEEVIYSTKLVKDVYVIGIPDCKWGQAVTAIYVPLKPENNLSLIEQQVKSQLANYKQPKNWIEVDNIPRNNRGKVNYQELKAIALQSIDSKQ